MTFLRRAPPRVDVVVPLYNHAAYIAEAIGSILAQGGIVRRVIVLDDGSTDGSAAAMEKLARQDARIHFERQANQGAHAALNRGIGLCEAEFCAVLNSDDVYAAHRLERLAAALDEDPGATIAAAWIDFIDGAGRAVDNDWYAAARAQAAGTELGLALLNGNFLMTTSNLMFRRAAWPELGAFAPLRYTHDLDWLLRVLSLGHRITVRGETLLRYRMHATNTINEDHAAVRVEWALAAAAYLTALWDGAPEIDWAHAGAAQTVLRRHALDRAVPLAMAALRREGAKRLDASRLALDREFKAQLRAWL